MKFSEAAKLARPGQAITDGVDSWDPKYALDEIKNKGGVASQQGDDWYLIDVDVEEKAAAQADADFKEEVRRNYSVN